MIDGLQAAMAKISNVIPRPVLDMTFLKSDYSECIDRSIINEVLIPRMRDDISLKGGKILKIALQQSWSLPLDHAVPGSGMYGGHYSMYHIPPNFREYRDISAVMNISHPYHYGTRGLSGSTHGFPQRGNSLVGLSKASLAAQTNNDYINVPIGDIRTGNVIVMTPPQYNFIPWMVQVRLRYDDNFTGMDTALIGPFAELCVLVVKAHIYNKLIVDIDSNLVYRGAELGIVGDIVREYKDATERYDEMLTTFGGVEYLSIERFQNIAKMITSPV